MDNMPQKTKMSIAEKEKLKELEAVIRDTLQEFVHRGRALKEIKESELFRDKYKSFEDYVRKEWDLGKTYAYDQINAFNVVENLKDGFRHGVKEPLGNGDNGSGDEIEIILPKNESQARPLTNFSPTKQFIAWQKALKLSKGRPTALIVRKVVEEMTDENIDQESEESKAETKTGYKFKATEGLTPDFIEFFSLGMKIFAKHESNGWKALKRKKVLAALDSMRERLINVEA